MEAIKQPMSTDPSQYVKQLVERLDISRRNDTFCDVTVSVNSRDFKAHKCVLAAASPFFFSLLKSDMRESREQLIKIELEEATESVMQDVLQYIYTGILTVTEDTAHNMIATADYLLLPSLKTVVGRYLMENLTIENCIFNYYFADKYRCEDLEGKAREVINSNFTAVMETDNFLGLNMKQVMEWVSSDEIIINAEEEVFKGIVNWIQHSRSQREGLFADLLHQVRLISIPHDFLLNELVKQELVAKNPELCSKFVLDAMRVMVSAAREQVIQQPRKCLETHRDAIFVCGGRKSLCYLPEQNLWYKLSDMICHHDNESTPIQCRGKVFIPCNESDKLGESYLMECYTPASNSWGAIQAEDEFHYTAILNGSMYTVCDDSLDTYRYDAEKNYWDVCGAPPGLRNKPCVVTDEQYLYIIGGLDSYNCNRLWSMTNRFDPIFEEWKEVAPISEARYGAFGTSLDGKVYIAGGINHGGEAIRTCEVYNPQTNEWQLMANLRVRRACGSMVSCEGRLHVIGGYTCSHHNNACRKARIMSVEVFCSEDNEWKEKTAIPVQSFETAMEEKKRTPFNACFVRFCRQMFDRLQPIKN